MQFQFKIERKKQTKRHEHIRQWMTLEQPFQNTTKAIEAMICVMCGDEVITNRG